MHHRFATAAKRPLLLQRGVCGMCSASQLRACYSCCELLVQRSTSVDHRHIPVPVGPPYAHSEHDGEAVTC